MGWSRSASSWLVVLRVLRIRVLGIGVLGIGCAQGEPIVTGAGGDAGGPASSGGAGAAGGAACEAGESRCDDACVDLDTDLAHCGACDAPCAPSGAEGACVRGACTLGACLDGFADCDTDVANGCESPVSCDEGAACTTSCGSVGAVGCSDPCTPSCAEPAETCNALDDDCDGTCDEGPLPGCRVAVHRAYGASGHLFTTDLAAATAWGLEFADFFFLATAPNTQVIPLYRCAKAGTANTLLTTSSSCEGIGAPIETVGYVAGTASCASIPLYRLSLPGQGWHFYTISAAERDSAVAGGWVSEGVTGYVWTSP
jgi:hypothetical protein